MCFEHSFEPPMRDLPSLNHCKTREQVGQQRLSHKELRRLPFFKAVSELILTARGVQRGVSNLGAEPISTSFPYLLIIAHAFMMLTKAYNYSQTVHLSDCCFFRHIKEVVDANPLKLMSAIFNRPGQCTYAATCAHSETPPPSLLFCKFTPSIHPALLMVKMEQCSLVASAAHLDVCLYTPLSCLSARPLGILSIADPAIQILCCCPQYHP
ncbi:hypothetical protein DPX16_18691 [Anabarilius grahami]|uniref:Uncharacterized protein n=1 Tax=Anabarilius grahami TaxID=495550 RepID=A0A3N0Z259_ANAGA|nr:hypothetical protein DPX16_18691 [Anabarilius grahami]